MKRLTLTFLILFTASTALALDASSLHLLNQAWPDIKSTRVSICTIMSETANSVGGRIQSAFAESTMARRAAGASSFTLPTSVVSMWLADGVMIMTGLCTESKPADAFTMPHVAGRKSLSPLYGSSVL